MNLRKVVRIIIGVVVIMLALVVIEYYYMQSRVGKVEVSKMQPIGK